MRLPDRKTTSTFLRLYFILGTLFVCIYGTLNYYSFRRETLRNIYFDWELIIPFVPMFIYIYLSIFLVFFLPLFYFNTRQMQSIANAFLIATVIAGIIYLIFPAQLAYPRPNQVPGYELVFSLLYRIALPHNLFPSLHITYSTLFIFSISDVEQSTWIKFVLYGWLLLIIFSVLLVRQHHIPDVIAGVALGYGSYYFFFRKALLFPK